MALSKLGGDSWLTVTEQLGNIGRTDDGSQITILDNIVERIENTSKEDSCSKIQRRQYSPVQIQRRQYSPDQDTVKGSTVEKRQKSQRGDRRTRGNISYIITKI